MYYLAWDDFPSLTRDAVEANESFALPVMPKCILSLADLSEFVQLPGRQVGQMGPAHETPTARNE